MVAYFPYENSEVQLDCSMIKYHTSMIYRHSSPIRSNVCDRLAPYHDRLAVLSLGRDSVAVVDNADILSKQPDSTAWLKAPLVKINHDLCWSTVSAFVLALETNGGEPSAYRGFAPTLSEKTFRSMHLLRPCICFGGHNTRQHLSDLGFDTWDWFIDWTFDRESDYWLRQTLFLQELDRLMNAPIEQLNRLLMQHHDQLKHNQERLQWLVANFRDLRLPNLLDVLD
jgi:hypothetical protein